MPCDTIQISTIDLDQVADVDIMADALAALGWTVQRAQRTIRAWSPAGEYLEVAANGRVQLSSQDSSSLTQTRAAIAQEYSHQVVQRTAEQYGWNLEETPERKYVLTRRY